MHSAHYASLSAGEESACGRLIIRSVWLILAIVALIVSAGFNDLLWFELDGRFSYRYAPMFSLLPAAWLLRLDILARAPRHSRVFHCPEGSEWLGEEFAELRPNILVAQWLAEFPAFRDKWKLKSQDLERLTEDVVNLIQRDRVRESLSFDGDVLRRRVEISFNRVDLLPICVLSRPRRGSLRRIHRISPHKSSIELLRRRKVLLFGLTLQAVAATRLSDEIEGLPSREALARVAEVISARSDASDLVRPAFLALTGGPEPLGDPQIRLWNLLATAAALRVMFCHLGWSIEAMPRCRFRVPGVARGKGLACRIRGGWTRGFASRLSSSIGRISHQTLYVFRSREPSRPAATVWCSMPPRVLTCTMWRESTSSWGDAYRCLIAKRTTRLTSAGTSGPVLRRQNLIRRTWVQVR